MKKKKWSPAEVADLSVQRTEANIKHNPKHDSKIVGEIGDENIWGHES